MAHHSSNEPSSAETTSQFANADAKTPVVVVPNPQSEKHTEDMRTIRRIESMLGVHAELKDFIDHIKVSVDRSVIILDGILPTETLKKALLPAVRQAGVLGRVDNKVVVE